MNHLKSLLFAFTVAIAFAVVAPTTRAQTWEPYQQMNASQRAKFVSNQARNIGRRMSKTDYVLTPDFESDIQKALESYLQRLGNSRSTKTDLTVVMQRAQLQAPIITRAFKGRGVSPLIGLYIPWIESEFVNLSSSPPSGAIGMFQFLPSTGAHFGLSTTDLLDVEKSADAAARYIAQSLKLFDQYSTKEALAVLAYNRGVGNVKNDVEQFLNDQNSGCSICALSAQREKLSGKFKEENVYYVPRFFAAAIIGENPQSFGIQLPALSSL